MNYDFSEMKQQNDELEKELHLLKREYHNQQMSEEQVEKLRQTIKEAKMPDTDNRINKYMAKIAVTAAALVAAFIILPNTSGTVAYAMEQIPVIGNLVKVITFRDYEYESERHMAKIEVPEVVLEEQAANSDVPEVLEHSLEEINVEIQSITDEIVTQFETYLEEEKGYQEVIVNSEILTSTEEYFTLKLLCYQGAGSGYQWNYYYTVDLTTGERLVLRDIFVDGANYITPISENIKKQMQEQMDADEMVYYWLNDEIEEWNFKAITEETNFYLNENGDVVIGFDEGEVAPMYMGAVEFEIPAGVLESIRK